MIFKKKAEEIFRAQLYTRQDDKGEVFYFSHTDFPGLCREDFSFRSKRGHELVGDIYFYEGYDQTRLIVFDHGLGAGHRPYMREIEELCRHGYRVLTYDHTGCARSGGEYTWGFSQSLSDLDDCINAIKRTEGLSNLPISVVGHSWGGYSTLNITALHPEITHIVALAGFVSVYDIVRQYFGGILRIFRRHIMQVERESNPDFVDYDGAKTLKESSVKALLIYSDNDGMVKRKPHYEKLKGALAECDNVSLVLVSNKGHNPNYTERAVAYKRKFFNAVKEMRKLPTPTEEQRREFLASWDYRLMTEQDGEVWDMIFAHLVR